jgi:hypothetical protein
LIQLLATVAAIAVILLCTLLPFLPGGYDSLAVPVSTMARFGAMAALLFVPVGALWLVSRYSSGLAARRLGLTVLTLAIAALVWGFLSLAGWMSSVMLGVLTATFGVYLLALAIRRFRQPSAAPLSPGVLALCLGVLPIAVIALQWAIVPLAVDFSRDRAIRNSEPLIAAIERYHAMSGRYPVSLQGLWPDYKTGIMGIERYRYEPSGETYNVFFEQPALRFGTREIVMYNPRDEQEMTSHTAALLGTPEQLNRRRGYYASGDTAHPQWKYFWFD